MALPAWMISAGVILITTMGAGPVQRIGWFFLVWGLAFLAGPLVTAIHELGHAAGARISGMRIVRIVIGSGPLLVTRSAGGVALELRRYPASGYIVAHPLRARAAKWRQATFLLGGAAANGVSAVLCLLALDFLDPPIGSTWHIVLTILLWMNAATAIGNLVPFTGRRGRLPVPSDGKRLVALARDRNIARTVAIELAVGEGTALMNERRYREAYALFTHALESYPDSALLLGFRLASMAETTSNRDAIDWFLEYSYRADSRRDGGPGPGAFVYATAAWIAVQLRDPALSPVALALATSAVDLKVSTAEIDGIRAAAQIARGDHRNGVRAAYDAIRRSENEAFRAELALFLADGVRAGGNEVTADQLVQLASHLKERDEHRFQERNFHTRRRQPTAA